MTPEGPFDDGLTNPLAYYHTRPSSAVEPGLRDNRRTGFSRESALAAKAAPTVIDSIAQSIVAGMLNSLYQKCFYMSPPHRHRINLAKTAND